MWPVAAVLAASLVAMGPGPLTAQRGGPHAFLQITPLSDLSFGTVVPGIRTSVRPDQQRAAGMFLIQGQQNLPVRIDLMLPVAMVSPAGDQFPILFGRGDGVASANRGRFQGAVFDPHQPLVTTLGRSGRLYLRLGGTVAPNRLQVSGTYSATITLTVANLGT